MYNFEHLKTANLYKTEMYFSASKWLLDDLGLNYPTAIKTYIVLDFPKNSTNPIDAEVSVAPYYGDRIGPTANDWIRLETFPIHLIEEMLKVRKY